MIKGITMVEQLRLTKEAVLNKISEGDIFQFYLGRVNPGKAHKSPFHKDDNPSLFVSNRDGEWFYKDLANDKYKGDCFDLVMQMFGLSFKEALQKIDSDFGLGFNSPVRDYQAIVSHFKKHKPKPPSVIEVATRSYTLSELDYWNTYLQDISDLRREYIHSFSAARVNGKEIRRGLDELAFAYHFPELGPNAWKLYFPNRDRKEGKWISSIPTNTVERKEQLIGAPTGLITKSRKDRMVLQKFYPYVASVQNETGSAFNENFRNFLTENVEKVLLSFDNDEAGTRNCLRVTEEYGYDYLNVPNNLPGLPTDWAEWVAQEGGKASITNYLKQHHLI